MLRIKPGAATLRQLATAVVVVIGMACEAAQISYVAPTGNDANPGTIDQPWRTIRKASTSVAPGAVVNIRGGVYNEAAHLTVSGSAAGGYVTFQSYPGETAIVDGTNLTVSSSESGLVFLDNVSYVVVRGLKIRNYRTSVANLVPVGIRIAGLSHHVELRNNYIHNIEHNGTAVKGTDAHGIAVYGESGTQSINHLVIDGNELAFLKLGSSESLALNGNVEIFQITNNRVHDNNNIGIVVIGFEGTAPANDQGRTGVISGNVVYNIDSYGNPAYGTDRSADGIYVDGGTAVMIERNTVYHCNLGIELASEHAGKSTSDVTARDNLVYENDITGISIGGYDRKRGFTDSCVIVNNTLWHNDRLNQGNGEFYLQYDIRNNVIENNIVYAGTQNRFISNAYARNTGNTVDHNLYFSSRGARASKWRWKKVSSTGFATYQRSSGNDAHSHFLSPQLVNPAKHDFHPMAGSPGLDAGIGTVDFGPLDLGGNPRVSGAQVDLGAYEYQQRPGKRQ